jgi:hypothetical protein
VSWLLVPVGDHKPKDHESFGTGDAGAAPEVVDHSLEVLDVTGLTITSATLADSIAGVDAYVILREPGLRDPLPNSLPSVSLLDPGPGNTASITLPRPGDSHLVWEIAMLAHELDWWTNGPDYARPVITHHPYDVTITGIPSD